MAQAVSRWSLTAEAWVRAQLSPCGICGGQSGTEVFLRVLQFWPVSIIPPLLHTYLSQPHEVCDSPDKATHYHTLCPKLGASSLTRQLAERKEV
jgi:hypothetical protein